MALPTTITSTRTAAEHRADHQTLHRGHNRFYNVKDYGAVGDGVTDDSAAIASARDALVAAAVYTAVDDGHVLDGTLYFPAGKYLVTQQNALMSSPTGGTQQTLFNFRILGEGRRSSEVVFSSTQTATTDPRLGNLLLLANRVRGMRVESISFRSTNANQCWAWFWCTTGTGTYPEYGSGGAQSDIRYTDVEWRGPWKRVIGLDGSLTANQNSEMVMDKCVLNDTAVFGDAFFRSGNVEGNAQLQQEQFVNYAFRDCVFEWGSGNLLVFDKGGYITIDGGSWISGVNSAAASTMIKMGDFTHYDAVTACSVRNLRVELRTTLCQFLDTYWGDAAGVFTFENVWLLNNAASSLSEHLTYRFRRTDNLLPRIKFLNCVIAGYMQFDLVGNAANLQGRAVFEQCFWKSWTFVASGLTLSTTAVGGTGLRYSSGIPKYQHVNCWNVADVKS